MTKAGQEEQGNPGNEKDHLSPKRKKGEPSTVLKAGKGDCSQKRQARKMTVKGTFTEKKNV